MTEIADCSLQNFEEIVKYQIFFLKNLCVIACNT